MTNDFASGPAGQEGGLSKVAKASIADIGGVEAVVREVWSQEVMPDACEALINGETSALWVAKEADTVVGFASAFVTIDAACRRRCEIDLLAVSPSQQGKGLGPQLIAGACQEAESWDVDLIRALVRVQNSRSQRAFEKAGFRTDGRVHRLLLWPPDPVAERDDVPQGVSLIPVETVTYRGLWIEGLEALGEDEQRSVVEAARAIIAHEDRLNTGALIPDDQNFSLPGDLRDQAKLQGRYHWWVREES